MGYKDKKKDAEYKAQWQRDNAGAHRQAVAKSRKRNPEKTKQRTRVWRAEHPEKKLLQDVRARARRKGLGFDIDETDIPIPDVCPLLGMPLIKGTPFAASIDRFDNTKGYVKGNVWIVSRLANSIKGKLTLEELEVFAINLLRRLSPKHT